ncbi:MAG: ABC transporter permease [Clostridia bacterium]
MEIFNILKVTIEEGMMYAVLALGVYITFSILDFPDLSVDGTVPLGATLSGVMILAGINPWICCIVSFAAGAVAGSITGLLNVKLKIRPLLCGILVMTALLSINLVLMMAGTDGMSIASFFSGETIFNTAPASAIPASIGGFQLRGAILLIVLVVIFKIVMDLYLKTKSGLLLRAAGNNQQYVKMLGKDPGMMKVLGLALGNGFAALAGSLIAQQKGSADLQMGTGMVVIGLASVIIGTSLFRKVRFMKGTTKVIIGAVIYKACLAVALALGLPTEYLKLLMAVLFTIALVAGGLMNKKRGAKIAED